MVLAGRMSSARSNSSNRTAVACSEYRLKLTPPGCTLAPSGKLLPCPTDIFPPAAATIADMRDDHLRQPGPLASSVSRTGARGAASGPVGFRFPSLEEVEQ